MPYQSKAQQRLFYAMANRGEISEGTVHHWDEATKKTKGGFKRLPEKKKEKQAAINSSNFARGAGNKPFAKPTAKPIARGATGPIMAAPNDSTQGPVAKQAAVTVEMLNILRRLSN